MGSYIHRLIIVPEEAVAAEAVVEAATVLAVAAANSGIGQRREMGQF